MWMIVLAICLIVCAVFGPKIHKYIKLMKCAQQFRGPPANLILGNALEVGSNPAEFLKNFLKWWKIFGPRPYRLWLIQLHIFVADPKDVETVLLTNPPLPKAESYNLLRSWLGDGLLINNGMQWFKRRKVITPSFQFSILMNFFNIINETSNVFIKILEKKAQTGEIFDFQALAHYCTLDIICETAMGVKIDSMTNPQSELVQAYYDLCDIMVSRSFDPVEVNEYLFKFTKNYRRQKKALNIVKTITNEVIEKRRELLLEENTDNNSDNEEKPSKKKVFLDTLLTATIDGKPLQSSEIYSEVATFMFAGHDTTSSGISFVIYCLSRHLEVQKKAYQEQSVIFGNNLQRDATFHELADMKYLELIIKESLRMFPSVPYVARHTQENFNLNGKILAPGTVIVILFIAMGYNEKYFPNPEKFQPERFESTERNSSNPFDYVPFSAGPRNCIGQKFAMMEMKCILSKILRNFEVLPPIDEGLPPFKGANFSDDRHEFEPLLSAVLTLKSENGIKIRLRPRIT